MAKFNFRWGLPELDNKDGTTIPGFILRGYAQLGVTRDEFLCIVHLSAYHYNSPKGRSNPSLSTIAKQMGYAHKNSVWRLVQSLSEKGMLKIERRHGATSTYNVRAFAVACKKLSHKTVTLEGDTLQGDTPQGDGGVTLEGDTPSHPSVIEEREEEREAKKENPTSRKRESGEAKMPGERKPTARQKAIATLEMAFSETTGHPLPKRETARQRSAAGARWWGPLGELYELVDKDIDRALALMRNAIDHMSRKNLTIAAPQSIVSVAAAIFAKGQLSGGEYRTYEGDEAEAMTRLLAAHQKQRADARRTQQKGDPNV